MQTLLIKQLYKSKPKVLSKINKAYRSEDPRKLIVRREITSIYTRIEKNIIKLTDATNTRLNALSDDDDDLEVIAAGYLVMARMVDQVINTLEVPADVPIDEPKVIAYKSVATVFVTALTAFKATIYEMAMDETGYDPLLD